jgi:hypothetical protein
LLFLNRGKSTGTELYPSTGESELKEKIDRLIELIHSNQLSTNILLLMARDKSEMSNDGFPRHDFLKNRQSALEKYQEQVPNHSFYPGKLRENGSIHSVYVTQDEKVHEDFFQSSGAAYEGLLGGLEKLDWMLVLPYAAGESVTAADLHIVPWLSHALMAVGAQDMHDLDRLEKLLQKSNPNFKIGENTRKWWSKINDRRAVKDFYPKPH